MCLAIPGKVISISNETDETSRPGKVSFGGVLKEVNLCFLPEASVGDYVLVHVGVALSVVDEELAHETLNYLQQMGELDELEPESGSPPGSGPEREPESETEKNPGEGISQPVKGKGGNTATGNTSARNGESLLHPKSGRSS
ncbi:MAG: HypC/HybG/HupF family hydrogenase formation chaperone [Cyclonatronaceae bacterium]